MSLIKTQQLFAAIPNFDLPGDTVEAIELRLIVASLPKYKTQDCASCDRCSINEGDK